MTDKKAVFVGLEHCGPCPHNGGWANGWEKARKLEDVLKEIAHTSTSMPPTYNNEVDWYRHLVFGVIAIAKRAVEE